MRGVRLLAAALVAADGLQGRQTPRRASCRVRAGAGFGAPLAAPVFAPVLLVLATAAALRFFVAAGGAAIELALPVLLSARVLQRRQAAKAAKA